ncbi:MAG TPA: hypothetical protein VFG10_05705 [Saprospiraceae bacterium]|nr:hypothetical protein [Saprospiraceae bacterium]
MKKILSIIFSCAVITYSVCAQARFTPEIKQRLEGITDFYEAKNEIIKYYAAARAALSPTDSLHKRMIKRQLKFWNRWFYDTERILEADGSAANWSKKMLEAENRLDVDEAELNHSRAANSSWSLIGPINVDVNDGIGRVLRLGFHPTNDQIIYAGAARGGLWRSSNGGANWSAISSYLPSLGVSGIEVSKDDPNTIYILSGEGDAWISGGFTFNYGYVSYSNGVYKSTDGGNSWTSTAEFDPGINDSRFVGFQLRQDPTNGNTIIAATSEGVFRTTNGGSSWTRAVFNNLPTPAYTIGAYDIEYKPSSATTVYAACWVYDNEDDEVRRAFFRSTNGGTIFNEVDLSDDIDIDELTRFDIGVTAANPGFVFLLCGPGYVVDGDGSNDSFLGFLKSTNSGVSFTNIATEPDILAYNPTFGPTMGNQCLYDMALAVSPTNANLIFTGGLVIYKSTNGGIDFSGNTNYWTWETGSHIHPDVHELRFNPLNGNLYAGSDGGVFVSEDNGGSWDAIFNGLSITQFYHSEPDNENNKLWGGTQDNGTLEQESGGNFSEFGGGDGFDVMTDNIVGNGNDSYWSSNCCVTTSDNFGDNDITPPDPNLTGRAFGNLEMNPTEEDYIYIGYSDAVWYSNDQGDSWETSGIRNTLDSGVPKGDWCIQTCPSNSSRMYAAGSGSIWRVDDIDFDDPATGTSTNLRSQLTTDGFPTNSAGTMLRKITDILVHPSNSLKIWITAGGFYEGKKVFYRDFNASNWVNISYNLPNVPANCLLYDTDGTIYVGMDAGVYYLPPGEDHWIPFYNNLPRVPVSEMNFVTEFTPPTTFTKYIYASTFGRGIWKSQTFTGCTPSINITQNLRGEKFYQAGTSITSTSLVDGLAGTYVYFQSGNAITLNPGFEGKEGIVFYGYIQPCNTGPLPSGVTIPISERGLKDEYVIPAMVKSVQVKNSKVSIMLNVHKTGVYGIQLRSEDGEKIKDLVSPREFQVGQTNITIGEDEFEKGFQYIALMGDENLVHFQECNIK